MPQLDPTWFVSQFFWLLVSFGLMFALMKVFVLPKVISILDERERQIETNLKMAENLKVELESAIAAYEKALGDAHGKVGEILKQTNREIQEFIKGEEAKFGQRMKQRTDEAKGRIETSKEKILTDIEAIATELAGKIVFTLISENVPEDVLRNHITKEMRDVV